MHIINMFFSKGKPWANSLDHKIITYSSYYYLFFNYNNKRKKLDLIMLGLAIYFSGVTPDLCWYKGEQKLP